MMLKMKILLRLVCILLSGLELIAKSLSDEDQTLNFLKRSVDKMSDGANYEAQERYEQVKKIITSILRSKMY